MDELSSYIRQARQRGLSEGQIRNNLLNSGWTDEVIANALRQNISIQLGKKMNRLAIFFVLTTLFFGYMVSAKFAFHSWPFEERNTTVPIALNSTDLSQNPSSTPIPDLKTYLEGLYYRFKESIKKSDYDATFSLVEGAKDVPQPSREQFEKSASMLDQFYPDLTGVKFLAFKQKGEWAGFYVQDGLQDINYITITLIKFHQINGDWKVYGGMETISWNVSNKERTIENEIETNPRLQL